ncbi:MAG: carboxypeptidase M32 [Lachnospiraceae bacterium]|nr:carboxypeptidase M32 [Lachnospiraceae bacterium]
MSEKLTKLKDILAQLNRLTLVNELLYWDMRTIMPKEGFDGHAEATEHYETKAFRIETSDELYELLGDLSQPEEWDQLDDDWKFIVKTMREDQERSRRIPEELFSRMVSAQTEAERAWEEAKEASDYSIFSPHLAKLIDLTKEVKALTHPEMELYDALLDDYEKGMDSATIDRIFTELKEGLVPLVRSILAAEQPDDSKFNRKYDLDAQRKVQKLLLTYIGFNWDKGTVGESEHPFTLDLSSKDVRVTNHFREDNAIDPMFSAIHEGGHAIFEQNVDPKLDGTPAGGCDYLGIHESQSRFFENILGRNINFWKPIYADIQKLQPEFADITLEEFAREINHVRASMIRTAADEVTYCLHVILRYEVEKAIFREGVGVDELPALWNRKMQEYLGITPANDAEGILQDMHWSDGSFGYFPTYLLGSIYDGMFLEAMEAELGSVDTLLAEGKIGEIRGWLNRNIHRYGCTRLPKEVLLKVCGREATAEPLLRYFREKYAKYYNLQ